MAGSFAFSSLALAVIKAVVGSLTSRALATAALLALVAFLLLSLNLLQRLDLVIYDLHADLLSRAPHEDVRIVAIDDKSLQALGRWPWPREVHGELIEKLTAAGARAIGMDLLFNEADDRDPQSDDMLAEAMAASGRVVLPLYPGEDPLTRQLVEVLPFTLFADAAADLGHVDAELDIDAVSRSVFLQGGVDKPRWPSLSLAMLKLSQPEKWQHLPGRESPAPTGEKQGLWLRDHLIMIPFAGPPGHFETLSYVDVLKTPVEQLALQGKWLLVGATAVGMDERIATPTSAHNHQMSGVEYHANVIDTLLRGLAIEPLGFQWNLALTLLPIVFTLSLYLLVPPRGGVAVWIGMLLATLAISTVSLLQMDVWFPPATALLLVAVSYPIWQSGRLLDARRQSINQQASTQASYDAMDQAVLVADNNCRLQYMSSAAEKLTGFGQEQVRGKILPDFLKLVDEEGNGPFDRGCRETRNAMHGNRFLLSLPSGEPRLLWVSAREARDRLGHQRGWIVTLRQHEEAHNGTQPEDEAFLFDPLTRLANRTLLMIQLKQLFQRAERSGSEVALLFINLEQLQQIDDKFNYHQSDQLLQEIAKRIEEVVRKSDILARNGSEQFVVVLEDLGSQDAAEQVAEKIVARLREPFPIPGHHVEVAANIGISLFPRDGKDPEGVLKRAYAATPGKFEVSTGRYEVYSHQRHARLNEKRSIERGLFQALKRNELELFYQPQLETATGNILAAEALLRWQDGDGRPVAPATFIPVAEECGLIHEIGEWVFDAACRQLRLWQDQGIDDLRIAINLSPVQLERQDLISNFLSTIEAHRLDPLHVELEITEGIFIDHADHACNILGQLQALGGSIAIDDFGTGYSSFGILKQLPINRLKIDQSLVSDLVTFQDDVIILRTIISMAHGLGLEVVAEGVETPEQLALLKQEGCDLIQGYLIARPLPADTFAALAANWSGSSFYRNLPT